MLVSYSRLSTNKLIYTTHIEMLVFYSLIFLTYIMLFSSVFHNAQSKKIRVQPVHGFSISQNLNPLCRIPRRINNSK